MARYDGCILRKGETAICRNVAVDYSGSVIPLDAPDKPVWSGKLLPPITSGLKLGEIYTLQMPGFSECLIQIKSDPHLTDAQVEFDGIGAEPRSNRSGADMILSAASRISMA